MIHRTRALVALTTITLLSTASHALAQRPRFVGQSSRAGNAFSLETYAGGFQDAYDLSESDTGYLLGLRVDYRLASRARIVGDIAYGRANDVAFDPASEAPLYDNIWVMTTGGFEYDVIPGRTSASLALQGGVAWRRTDLSSGNPDPGDDFSSDGFASYDVIVPRFTVRRQISQRAALALGFQDFMIDVLEGPTDHSPALTLGIVFR